MTTQQNKTRLRLGKRIKKILKGNLAAAGNIDAIYQDEPVMFQPLSGNHDRSGKIDFGDMRERNLFQPLNGNNGRFRQFHR